MIRWLAKRFLSGFLVIWGIVTLLFLVFSGLGDPSQMVAGQRSDLGTIESIRAAYYLDKPLPVQYLYYLRDLSPISTVNESDPNFSSYRYAKLFRAGEETLFVVKWPYMRRSFQTDREVSSMIVEKLPGTLILGVAAMLIASVLGILLGTISGIWKDTWIDRGIVFFTLLGVSAPSFFIGVLILWVMAILLGDWTGLNATGYMIQPDVFGEGNRVVWRNLLLPATALGIRPLAIITQLTRSSMIEVLAADYIRTARAKGLSKMQVVIKHALQNALNPVLTSISGWFASLLAGAFFIELIFNWQGIGKLTIDALNKNDYPVILGCALVIGVLFVLVNMLVDFLYTRLDPRVKLQP